MAHILIIEDEDDIRDYVVQVLTDQGFSVHATGKGAQGWRMIERHEPDLVVLDLGLPDISGESLAKRILQEYPHIAIVILTAKGEPSDIADGLQLGVDDYISKPFAAEELAARVKARLRRGQKTERMKVGDLIMDTKSHTVKRNNDEVSLSPQEFRLLEFFMRHPGQVLSRDMILTRIWGTSADVETRVVDVYVGYLRKKIDEGHSKELIKTVRGFGYMLDEEADL